MTVLANAILSLTPIQPPKTSSGLKPTKCSSVVNLATPIAHKFKRRCEFLDMHTKLVPYANAWSWQKDIVKQRKLLIEHDDDFSDTLIILLTNLSIHWVLGTGSSEAYLNFDMKNASLQLVMYPIINLHYHTMDPHWYLRALEEVIIRALSSTFSIKASRVDGLTGVWVGDRKLAAVGIKVSQWITYHGLALNVTTDLRPFYQIVPCGIQDHLVGSIKGLLWDAVSSGGCETENGDHVKDYQLIDMTCKSLVMEFCEVFQVDLHHKPVPVGISKGSTIGLAC